MLDIFAWVGLIILIASTVVVIVFMAMLPGIIAKSAIILGHTRSRWPDGSRCSSALYCGRSP